jgi:BirA family biotin operon repressor/biotin-[acetyl-CoA-carboxylase] ligase
MTVDAQILKALRTAGEEGLSAAELAQRLGQSRAAIRARIEELRTLGYDIPASPHLGYRLESSPEALHADDLLSRLGQTRVIGRDIRVFERTTSTNDVIEKLARDGVKEGVVVFAEAQSQGRGRLGRTWTSPAHKGLWFSILLRPDMRPQAATQLTVAAAASTRRAIALQTALQPEVKWPNDILVRGRKVAGILTELRAEVDRLNHVILGIGVDVNLNPSDFPPDVRKLATSLKIESGQTLPRSDLAVVILRELDRDYGRIVEGRFGTVADEWEEHCSTLGQDVCIEQGQRRICGRAESLGEDGALLVRTEHGHLERVLGGDVVVQRGSGRTAPQ